MAPLVLEGNNLGEKHKHYNKLLKEALADNSTRLTDINYQENDIDNLIKIDIANCNKNVEYILQVLKCDDMLYVSRAIRNCSWLITNKQYAHIINPHYLDSQLLPYMSSKAICKFMLNIRLKLKDENRVDEFFKYYIEKDETAALKWLPNCSPSIIEAAVKEHVSDIDNNLLKRLCEKSIKYLEIFVNEYPGSYGKTEALKATIFLLKKHTDKYLQIYESVEGYIKPELGYKATQIILKKYPNRITDNYETYIEKVHLPTVARHMKHKNKNIKEFVYKLAASESLKSSCWINNENLKPFLGVMTVKDKLEFVENYVNKLYKKTDPAAPATTFYCALEENDKFSDKLYNWYALLPFSEAFNNFKKLLRSESSPDERVAMLSVLLRCAHNDNQNILSLLQFYHDKHINEPFKFKIRFIHKVLSKTKTYRYDENMWNILNKIFHSMEVYIESNNNVQICFQSIIMYNVLHKVEIPEAIEKKASFDTFKSYLNQLNTEEKEVLFTYLLTKVKASIDAISLKDESKSDKLLDRIKEAVTLLNDWGKDVTQYTWLLDIIKQLLNYNEIKPKLNFVYNKKNSWRKHLFEESLKLFPSENACINALKHDSHLLYRNKVDVEAILRTDSFSLQRFLGIIRIYWPLSFANDWKIFYTKGLDEQSAYKARVCGLLTLLPQQELTELLKKYAPTESKIAWSETDEIILGLQKQIAKNMQIARPQPAVECVLWYAKGDYLQYALPSLNSILSSLSANKISECISLFLNAPVSLQKNCLHVALPKLDAESKMNIIRDTWKKSTNSSIRAVCFKNTFDMLCNEKEQRNIKNIWQILDSFIDNLTADENKVIYGTLSSYLNKLPYSVIGEYCTKSYKFLKSLPEKANCQSNLREVLHSMKNFMELLDSEFVANILLEFIENKYIKVYAKYEYELHVLATYLLCASNEESSTERINKVLKPLLRHTFENWECFENRRFFVKDNFQSVLNHLGEHFEKYILTKRMINPIKLFSYVQTEIEKNLPIDENYVTARSWKIIAIVSEVLENHKAMLDKFEKYDMTSKKKCCENINYNELYMTAAADLGERFHQCLTEDIKLFYPSIYVLFLKVFYPTISPLFDSSILLKIYKSMLRDNHVQSYLVVQQCLYDTYHVSDVDRPLVLELRDMMLAHTSLEVKMHYYNRFNQQSNIELYFKIDTMGKGKAE